MSQPRLRLEKSELVDGVWRISPDEARHLVRVRRCCTGSIIEGLLDGEKLLLRLRCDGDEVLAEELSRTSEPLAREVCLLLALLKSDQLDISLRLAAELAVSKIHLLQCERSVPKLSGGRAGDKMARWQKILDEATKQAGAARTPLLETPRRFGELDFAALPQARYAALLSDAAVPIRQVKIEYPAVVAIGPEGDWSPLETRKLLENGFQAIGLGSRILRASTAVAVACSWLALL